MAVEEAREDAVAEFKQAAGAVWAAGDYDLIATKLWSVGGRLVHQIGVEPADDVLDVACGTGNAAIPAAALGAHVVALDLVPELFAAGRARAAAAGVEVEWVQGDAEELPFDDARFDLVLSVFGCMFAPRHRVAAREIIRVTRPGGRIGVCSWTPDGFGGDFFDTLGAHLPAPPPFAEPPALWGSEDHARRLFADSGLELRFQRDVVELRFPSVEDAVETYATTFGPVVKARESLTPDGRWPALRRDLSALFRRHVRSAGTQVAIPAHYLTLTGRKPARTPGIGDTRVAAG